ncbi:MAG TPA: hypothetical protein VGG06_22300 [Thermoanaerobaculia bacterium]|jgi:hypothetical protein
MHPRRLSARRALKVLVVLGLAGTLAAREKAQETAAKEAPPPLAIEAVRIEPSAPAADTLCQLRVVVRNAAERPVSALDFGVALGGTQLKVYDQQLFLENLAPGATTEIRLYNFWTTETGRPAPADGKLRVTVTLRAAQWVAITTEDDGTEVWTLGEPVPGLPVEKELVVPLSK